MRTLHDIYKCISCGYIAAHGNSFCRSCGIKFTDEDIHEMQKNIQTYFGASPWNTRDIYRCVHCTEHVALADNYCRGCGDQIDNHEKQLMKLKMSELARKNTPSLIGLAALVIAIVAMFILL